MKPLTSTEIPTIEEIVKEKREIGIRLKRGVILSKIERAIKEAKKTKGGRVSKYIYFLYHHSPVIGCPGIKGYKNYKGDDALEVTL